MGVLVAITAPPGPDRPPLVLEARRDDGAYTPGPYVCLSGPLDLELTEGELEWLVDTAGPAALARLRGDT